MLSVFENGQTAYLVAHSDFCNGIDQDGVFTSYRLGKLIIDIGKMLPNPCLLYTSCIVITS